MFSKKNTIVGILGFPKCIVNSTGLKYELKNSVLELGVAESISNRLVTSQARLSIKGEALVIYRY